MPAFGGNQRRRRPPVNPTNRVGGEPTSLALALGGHLQDDRGHFLLLFRDSAHTPCLHHRDFTRGQAPLIQARRWQPDCLRRLRTDRVPQDIHPHLDRGLLRGLDLNRATRDGNHAHGGARPTLADLHSGAVGLVGADPDAKSTLALGLAGRDRDQRCRRLGDDTVQAHGAHLVRLHRAQGR